MKFQGPALEAEFAEALDTPVRLTISALDLWSQENGLPPVCVTEVLRTVEEQEEIYTQYAAGLIYKLRTIAPLKPTEKTLALQLSQLSHPEVRDWARRRFSWHLVGQAVDIRSRHYSAKQLVAVMGFLRKRCPLPQYELLAHDVAGPHIHVARRDAEKRKDVQ